jgi:hypothetical protein
MRVTVIGAATSASSPPPASPTSATTWWSTTTTPQAGPHPRGPLLVLRAGLQELLGEVVRAGRLRIAGDKAEAVGHGP